MRLGGFVIHGESIDTLGTALDGLCQVADEVVAVDSGATDGSAELVRQRGVRRVLLPWQGYGAARAAAVEALAGCDYLFFIDSDEYLLPEAVEALGRWRAGNPEGPAYRVAVRDWAQLEGRRFLFRSQSRVRLVRYDAARWHPRMIVHESVGADSPPLLPLQVEHRFAQTLQVRRDKNERYALLWAVRAFAEGRRSKPAVTQRLAHLLRDLVVKGALFRGGGLAARLSWATSAYHSLKYRHLRALRQGAHPELLAHYQEGRYRELFEAVARYEA